MELFSLIVRGEIEYSPELFDDDAADIIEQLTIANPSMRLGVARDGHATLTSHAFFTHPAAVSFHLLPQRACPHAQPPHVPVVAHDADLSNIDASEAEEMIANMKQDPAWVRPVAVVDQALFTPFSL